MNLLCVYPSTMFFKILSTAFPFVSWCLVISVQNSLMRSVRLLIRMAFIGSCIEMIREWHYLKALGVSLFRKCVTGGGL